MIGKKWNLGLQKTVIGCMIILLLALSACQGKTQASVTDEETALQMLQSLQSYEAQVSITFYAQQGESTYTVNQKARQEGAYRMEIVEPAVYAGITTICDGEQIVQTDPTIGGQVSARKNPVRDVLFLYSFLEAYQKNPKGCSEEDADTLVLSAEYTGEHQKIVSGRLTLAKGSGMPLSLVISDQAGNPSLHMTFQSFEANPQLADENFQITTQSESEST